MIDGAQFPDARTAVELEAPGVQEDRPRAQQAYGVHRVADDDDRRPAVLQRSHAVEALQLERQVADGQDLVIFHAERGTRSAQSLALLASMAAVPADR